MERGRARALTFPGQVTPGATHWRVLIIAVVVVMVMVVVVGLVRIVAVIVVSIE